MDFARAFESALLNALRRPGPHPVLQDELRRVLLRRFLYAMFYRALGYEFLVVAVFHHRQDPALMEERQKARPDIKSLGLLRRKHLQRVFKTDYSK